MTHKEQRWLRFYLLEQAELRERLGRPYDVRRIPPRSSVVRSRADLRIAA